MYRNSMKKHIVIIALMTFLGLAIIIITVIHSPKRRMQNIQSVTQEEASTVKEKEVKGKRLSLLSAPQKQVVTPTPQAPEALDDTSTFESEKELPASEASLPETSLPEEAKQQLIKKLTEEAKDFVRGKTGTSIVTRMTSRDWMTLEDEAQFQDLMTRLEDLGQNTATLWRIHDLYIRKHTLFHADPNHTANDLERRRIMEEDFFVCKELAQLGEPMFWVYTDPVTGEELASGSYEDAVLGEWPFIFR